MNDKKKFILLAGIMAVVAVVVGGIALLALYQVAFEEQRARLVDTVTSQARLMESIARFNQERSQELAQLVSEDRPGPSTGAALDPDLRALIDAPATATLAEMQSAHLNYKGFGETGEFTLARRVGDQIVFVWRHRHFDLDQPHPVPFNASLAEPMRRALSGQSGTVVGLDYRNVEVLAAHEPVEVLDLGIVAKIDLAEIRAPFLRAAGVVLIAAFAVIGMGVLVFFRVSNPMARRLQESEARFGAIVANVPGVIYRCDPSSNRTIQFVSDSVTDLVGLSASDLMGPPRRTLAELIHPLDRDRIESSLRQAIPNPAPFLLEYRLQHADGKAHWVQDRGQVVQSSDGGPCWMAGSIVDVTESKRNEESLILAKQVFEGATDAIVVTDRRGIILDVNPAFTRITGFARDEAIGQSPNISRSDRHDDAFYRQMWKALHETGCWAGEIWDRRKSGEIYPKWLAISTVFGEEGAARFYVGLFSDITRKKETEARLEQLAYYDPLTRLPNRSLFQDRLVQGINGADRRGQELAVFFIDLDRFKHVNDTLGHAAGDELLHQVARLILDCVRQSDTVARLGGDEFAVIITNVELAERLADIAQNIIAALMKPILVKEQEVFIGASIGIALFPRDGRDSDSLTRNADVAMYAAKAGGRNDFRFFSDEMNTAGFQRLQLEKSMHQALEQEEFLLHYQPKIDLATDSVTGMEALVRWNRPGAGLVSPGEFIPLAEDTGLIVPLGDWVLKSACGQMKSWNDAGFRGMRVAVNLSARQFQQVDLTAQIGAILDETGLSASCLELEITESMVMGNVEKAIETLKRLKESGLHIAMDDFGTGFSSLSYLKRFPIDTLKIDQSFVRDLTVDSDDAAIVSAIISMGRSLNLRIVAEGVENPEQLAFLKEQGCAEVQGFFFSRPLPSEAMERFILGGGEAAAAPAPQTAS